MKQVQPAASVSLRKPRSGAAEWIARTKAKLASRKIARGRFTRRDTEYDVLRGEVGIGVWLSERGYWRLYKLIVSNALNFEFQIDAEVPFAQLSGATFDPPTVILEFGDIMRITVGVSEIRVSCLRTDKIRSDWSVERRTFPLKASPPVPTT